MFQPRSSGRRALLRCAVIACVVLAPVAAARAQLTNVDEADDICPPTLDPCVINQTVQIVDGATLDFGRRAVELRGLGVLDIGSGTVVLRCGSFAAILGSANGILARGGDGTGTADGGSFTLEALRACTGDDTLRCISPADCVLGGCSVSGQCEGDASRACEEDADCDFGLCAIGTGDIDLNAVVRAGGQDPGSIILRAAGDLAVRQLLDADAIAANSDGGFVELVSGHASVLTSGGINVRGGGLAQGGTVSILAEESITASGAIDASGGDFDGGFIEMRAGGDLVLNGNLLADATNGEGSGGEMTLVAGNDLTIAPTRSLTATGSMARDSPSGGDGGTLELVAGNVLVFSAGALIEADGAEPNGFGDTVLLQARRDLTLDGTVSSRARGNEGQGGSVEVSGGSVTAGTAARIDVRGGEANGGDVLVRSSGPLTFAGTIAAEAIGGGTGDTVRLESATDLVLSGDITQGGQTAPDNVDGAVELFGCSVTLTGGASLTNTGPRGVNTLAARAGIVVQTGAQVIAAQPLGLNRFVLTTDSDAPVVQGTVNPAATIVIDDGLPACTACGNLRVDEGETCDDGNEQSGDGCSADCQNEGCIAQTLNWPNAPLCNDDQECTRDVCDVETSTCVNPVDCDDGFECTIDACDVDGSCLHDEEDAICDDANTCTADECLVSSGCVSFAEEEPCDDGLGCTSGDTCVDGDCDGLKNCPEAHFCSNVTGDCVAGSTTTTTTTTTTTLPPAVCGDGVVEGDEQCDDGDTVWELGQPCNGACDALTCGDADDSGDTKATDSLFALRSAVGGAQCHPCLCDVDSSGATTATDALALLRAAVGIATELDCPPCFPEP